MKNANLERLFTLFVVLLSTLQTAIPSLPISNPNTITLVSAIVMFLVVGLTAWKQYFSVEITNASLIPTVIIAIVATLGGLNDLIGAFHISPALGQWIRFAVTAVVTILNVVSKELWPSPAAKAIKEYKADVAAKKL